MKNTFNVADYRDTCIDVDYSLLNRRNVVIETVKSRGLILIVSYGGSRVFYLYKSIGPEQHRIRIGAFPYLTIDKARKKAFELKA